MDEIVIDQEQICEYVASKLGIDVDIATDVLDCEMNFFEENGYTDESKPTGTETPVETDFADVIEYIVAETGVKRELISNILEAEMEYLEKQGVAFRG